MKFPDDAEVGAKATLSVGVNGFQTNGVNPGPGVVSLSLRSNEAGAGATAEVDPASHFSLTPQSPYALTIQVSTVDVADRTATIEFEVSHDRSNPAPQVEVFVQPGPGVASVSAPETLPLDRGRGFGTVRVELDPEHEQAELLIAVDAPGFNSPSETIVLDRRTVDPSPVAQWRWIVLGAVLLLGGGYMAVRPARTSSGSTRAAAR